MSTVNASLLQPKCRRRELVNPTVVSRRAVLVAGGGTIAGCGGASAYDQAVGETWRHAAPPPFDRVALLREIVRCATLAPSSHNTQCWRFRVAAEAIELRPDTARRTPVVDPDDHHLLVSLGCAVENLVHAAAAHGFAARPQVGADGAVHVALAPAASRSTPLFQAIAARQCTRLEFDGRPLSGDDLRQLEAAGRGDGVQVLLLTERRAVERVLQIAAEANARQIEDRAYVDELEAWLRFSDDEALQRRDGLFVRTTGNPTLPRWLGARMFHFFYDARSENDKLARQLRSSAGVAVFASVQDDAAHRIEAGRCYQRFALQATALGIRNALVNQPVEVAALRPRFAAELGLAGQRPHLVARFGRGPLAPRSLRRPVGDVLD